MVVTSLTVTRDKSGHELASKQNFVLWRWLFSEGELMLVIAELSSTELSLRPTIWLFEPLAV